MVQIEALQDLEEMSPEDVSLYSDLLTYKTPVEIGEVLRHHRARVEVKNNGLELAVMAGASLCGNSKSPLLIRFSSGQLAIRGDLRSVHFFRNVFVADDIEDAIFMLREVDFNYYRKFYLLTEYAKVIFFETLPGVVEFAPNYIEIPATYMIRNYEILF